MIQDALYRLDPKAGGFFMIMIAWFGLVGSAIIGFFAGWWVNLRIAAGAGQARSLGDAIAVVQNAYDTQIVVDVVTTLMSSFGAIVLVMVMFRIESRARARDGEIRKAAVTPRAEPGNVGARPAQAALATSVAAPASAPAAAARAFPAAAAAPVAAPAGAAIPGATAMPVAASPPAMPVAASPPAAAQPFHPATGPRLHVRVDNGTSMTATLHGESEAITVDELREAAAALARADGSAVIAAADRGFETRSLAEQALEILTAARVPATIED
jgi:hypothetical protein